MRDDKSTANRRDFLKLAGTSLPAAAALAVSGGEAEAAEAAGEGLRKTEHVKKYIESARF